MLVVLFAMRAGVNEEVAAAFAASTQKYLLGTDGDAFADKTKWSAFIGSIFEVTKNSDGDIPQFGQLAQPSMQPMAEHFANLCKRMSAATGIHVGQFGIVSDNPSSADAIYLENSPLILKCQNFIKETKAALSRVAAARSAILARQQASSSTSTETATARSCLGSRATRTRSWPRELLERMALMEKRTGLGFAGKKSSRKLNEFVALRDRDWLLAGKVPEIGCADEATGAKKPKDKDHPAGARAANRLCVHGFRPSSPMTRSRSQTRERGVCGSLDFPTWIPVRR